MCEIDGHSIRNLLKFTWDFSDFARPGSEAIATEVCRNLTLWLQILKLKKAFIVILLFTLFRTCHFVQHYLKDFLFYFILLINTFIYFLN